MRRTMVHLAAPGALLLGLPLWSALAACSADPAPADSPDSAAADGGADSAVDAADAITTTADAGPSPTACPGGWGCACQSAGDCSHGLCLPGAGAASACATPCQGFCPAGQRCRELAGSTGLLWVCVEVGAHACDPCTKSKDCKSLGNPEAACLDHGPAGQFCAIGCQGDAECASGYRCAGATTIDGGSGMFCVRVADAGQPPTSAGTCPCSGEAAAASLATPCYAETFAGGKRVGRCDGSRSCAGGTLSACSAATPAAEICNGVDDDCDGQTDEGTCDDGKVCTDDACNPIKGCDNVANTALCDADGSACTVGDACKAGVCVAGPAQGCNDNNACTKDTCDPISGCRHLPADASACDDGQPCTKGDTCLAGACKAGSGASCDDAKPCTIDSCDPTTGACSNALTAGLLCDDGKQCSHTDLCASDGNCSGSPLPCDDGKPCTIDACDETSGCNHKAGPDGAGCEDGDDCTGPGTCLAGGCLAGPAKVCSGDSPCHVAVCLATTGACVQSLRPAGAACDDGNACTDATLCTAGGVCKGKDVTCDDGKPCTTDSCDKLSGCQHSAAADGSACEDGDACTGPDTCTAGACKAGADICQCQTDSDCDDKDTCTIDACDKAKSTCSHTLAAGPCDDGDACSEGDACAEDGGKISCTPGKTKTCNDNEPCTDDACDKTKGCVAAAKADGTACDDGDACSQGEACASGKCAGGKDICACAKDGDCDDGNACTTNACDLGKGTCAAAIPLANGATCTDGDACTGPDTCAAGACQAGAAVSCDDGDVCTIDSCDAFSGCKKAAVQDGATCDDGDACTQGDVCTQGVCLGKLADATVATWAGGAQGYTDAKGILAAFMAPTGLTRVADGTLYVADFADNRVRRIATDQQVTSVCGDGIGGQTDGKGAAARLWGPAALVGDAQGDLWVIDRSSHLVRRVTKPSSDAEVTTIAGSNTPGGFGQPPVGGFADGKGAAAKFDQPSGIAFTGAGFIVADANNHRIRGLSSDGEVTTLAGSGSKGSQDGALLAATFDGPHGVAVAGDGGIWVADRGGRRIRRLAAGAVVTIAGDGTAGNDDGKGAAARFQAPWGLAMESTGALLVADQGGHRLRRVKADGTVTTYLGSSAGSDDGKISAATLDGPTAVVDAGKGVVFVATQTGFRIRKVDDPSKACGAQ